jgi:hypothetical protein
MAARCCPLALGQATLHSVTILKGEQWYHWEPEAHSEDPKHTEGLRNWYLHKVTKPPAFLCPQICPPFGSSAHIEAQEWEDQAEPEATKDNPELQAARKAAAQVMWHTSNHHGRVPVQESTF